MPELKSLCADLNDICPSLEFSACVYVKDIASIVGQIISIPPSCGNDTQIMTRYLHLVTNSRSAWNSLVCVHDQAKQERHFWRDYLRTLNGILFRPIPFVPSKGCGGFIQGSALVCHKNWSAEESQKSSARRKLAALTLLLKPLTIISLLESSRLVVGKQNYNTSLWIYSFLPHKPKFTSMSLGCRVIRIQISGWFS